MAEKQSPKEDQRFLDREEYSLRKRLPRKYPKRRNDIYVNRQTDFKAQQARCMRMLDGGYSEVYIHGLGAAVNRAINLALQVKKCGQDTIDVAVNTSTVELVDDFEPMRDDLEPDTRSRNNSAVHIRIFRINPVAMAAGDTLKTTVKSS